MGREKGGSNDAGSPDQDAPWQYLYFFPLLHGHGWFLPTFFPDGSIGLPRRCFDNSSSSESGFQGSLLNTIASTRRSLVARQPSPSHSSAFDLYLASLDRPSNFCRSAAGELGSDTIVVPPRPSEKGIRASWDRWSPAVLLFSIFRVWISLSAPSPARS
jgi:hypothetical protein